MNKFDLPADDAAFGIDLVDVHLKRLEFRVPEKRSATGYSQKAADLDWLGGRCLPGGQCQKQAGCQCG